ncbi:MAG: hypothetical protein ACSHW7_09615 [Patiriisocius sp.]|uniref:hypothetical protein n=1 Tax=Patiriisocius sp. TaxID=2822396 RepID=UPI003EFA7BB1
MKQITLTIALLFCLTIQAQLKKTSVIGATILDVINESKSISSLVTNHELVMGQYRDMKLWSQGNKISAESQIALQHSYNEYANQMNAILDALKNDLESLSTLKELKGTKLNKFIDRFDKSYIHQLESAVNTYNTKYTPAFNLAAQEANSKSGILGSIILILEIGETIYTSIKSLFTTGKIDKELEKEAVSLAMKYATDALDKQLRYPLLETTPIVNSRIESNINSRSITTDNDTPAYSKTLMMNENNNIQPLGRNRTDEQNNNTYGEIELSFYPEDSTIELSSISKNIIVAESDKIEIPMFSTAETLKTGDRFWVKLEGYDYADFFYFDSNTQSWQDPFGKGIIVGGGSSRNKSKVTYLPSKDQYFEITGTTSEEQFMILISNAPIGDQIRNQILNNDLEGVLFLEDIGKRIPNMAAPYPLNSASHLSTISWASSLTQQIYVPVFIKIEKTKNQ